MSGSSRACWLLVGAIPLLLVACGEKRNEKEVYKVTGRVLVDGKPTEGIQIGIHATSPADKQFPTSPQGQTDAEGKMIISTYAQGDGLPSGDYTFTFTWQDFNLMARSYSGPDKLKKKYADPKTSKVTASVDAPVDLGDIELSTK